MSAIPAIAMQPILKVDSSGFGGSPNATLSWSEETPWGLSPQQILSAYSLDDIPLGAIKGDGTGQTIAIIDAYDDPSLVDSSAAGFSTSDLARFDQQFGLPDPPSFLKINQFSSSSNLPATDPSGPGTPGNWEEEEAMDVEWTHALAPQASILLVECSSNSSPDLYQGASAAASFAGVSVVSMSWGCGEFNGEETFDSNFTTPSGHQGVTFVASAGDAGSPGMYPAYSPNVVAVGGTSLTLSGGNSYGGETAWSNGGGGISLSEPEPVYQRGAQGTGMRTIPDIAFDADPNSGVSVYDSYNDTAGNGPWKKIGGTSLGAPCWTALIAIADQGRVAQGAATLDGPSQTLPVLYSLAAGDFHDITAGSNGGFNAGPGYDETTGLGSPVADVMISDLASYNIAPQLAVTAGPPDVVTAGQSFGLTVQVENPDGSLDVGYLGNVTISLAGNSGADTLGGTLTVTSRDGVAIFSGLTLTHVADGYTLWATTDGMAAAATTPFAVAAAAPAGIAIATSPQAGNTASLTLSVEDIYGNVVTTFAGSLTVQLGGKAGHGRTSRHKTLSAIASQGVVSFARVKLGPTGRGYAVQASGAGLNAETVITLDANPAVAKLRTQKVRVIRSPSKTVAEHHPAAHAIRVHRR